MTAPNLPDRLLALGDDDLQQAHRLICAEMLHRRVAMWQAQLAERAARRREAEVVQLMLSVLIIANDLDDARRQGQHDPRIGADLLAKLVRLDGLLRSLECSEE